MSPPVPTDLEQILRSFLAGQRKRQWPPPQQRPARRYWTDMVCFSCGKSGHAATRCPNLDESFPFMQPGWQTEKTPGGFIMIPPRVAMDRRRAENSGRPGTGGSCLGSVDTFGPGTQEVEQYRLFPHDG